MSKADRFFTKDALITFGLLFGVVFLVVFFSSAPDATFCMTDHWCFAAMGMGKIFYSLAVAFVQTILLFVLLFIAQTAWVVTWGAFMAKPYVMFAVVASGTFFGCAAVQIGKDMAGFLTPFQEQLFPYVTLLDVSMGFAIIAACVFHSRHKKSSHGAVPLLLFIASIAIFFANMLTIPSDVYGWSDFLPFLGLIVVLYLFLGVALLARRVRLRKQKNRAKSVRRT